MSPRPHPTPGLPLVVGLAVWLLSGCTGDRPPAGSSGAPVPLRTDTTEAGLAWSAAGAGPAVALIHGTNLDRRIWAPVVDDLTVDHTVVAYDLRSHGASASADGPWSDLDDLSAVLDAADASTAILVGLSAGAGIALEYALAHPDRVSGLVLVSPSVRGFRPEPGEVPDVFGPLMSALATDDSTAVGDALTALPTFRVGGPDQARVDRIVRANLRLFRVDPTWARSPATPPLERLSAVAVPVRVVVGTGDFAATLRLARELAASIPGAGLHEVADGPHLLPVSDPHAVVEAVRSVAAS